MQFKKKKPYQKIIRHIDTIKIYLMKIHLTLIPLQLNASEDSLDSPQIIPTNLYIENWIICKL